MGWLLPLLVDPRQDAVLQWLFEHSLSLFAAVSVTSMQYNADPGHAAVALVRKYAVLHSSMSAPARHEWLLSLKNYLHYALHR